MKRFVLTFTLALIAWGAVAPANAIEVVVREGGPGHYYKHDKHHGKYAWVPGHWGGHWWNRHWVPGHYERID